MITFDPTHENFLDTLNLLLTIIGGIGGLYLFIVGLNRYSKDQQWRRNEFVASEIKEFTSDKIAKNAMSMIDWGERYIELYPDEEKKEDRFEKVDRKLLKSALLHHSS